MTPDTQDPRIARMLAHGWHLSISLWLQPDKNRAQVRAYRPKPSTDDLFVSIRSVEAAAFDQALTDLDAKATAHDTGRSASA